MPRSRNDSAKYQDSLWTLRRAYEERAQAETYRWWLLNHDALGVPDHRVLFANGSWLGRPKNSAFFMIRRLHALGYDPGAPRLTLAVPSSFAHGLFIWLKHPDSPTAPELEGMRVALARQDYDHAVLDSAANAVRKIADYLAEAMPGTD